MSNREEMLKIGGRELIAMEVGLHNNLSSETTSDDIKETSKEMLKKLNKPKPTNYQAINRVKKEIKVPSIYHQISNANRSHRRVQELYEKTDELGCKHTDLLEFVRVKDYYPESKEELQEFIEEQKQGDSNDTKF